MTVLRDARTPPESACGEVCDELVVCSLENWDDVWRRNQFLVDELLRRSVRLRVLFVEPPVDPLFDLSRRRCPAAIGIRSIRPDGRLQALRPLKPLPRQLGPVSDRVLLRQVTATVRRLRFVRPTLWLNDVTYAPLIRRTRWPTVYDVTDDWLLAPFARRETCRLSELDAVAIAEAHEVVVCSPALAASRGGSRNVTLVPNGVDATHFQRPRQRPADLPGQPTAVYAGTLHDSRLDVDLISDLASSMPGLSVVLVGTDALSASARRQLVAHPNVHILGSRPYRDLPGYLQHAEVLIVPHRITPFTESLDPIKAYECLVVSTPTVATPVAGFRELAGYLHVAEGPGFVDGVARALTDGPRAAATAHAAPSWAARADAFESALYRSRCTAARRADRGRS